MPDDTRRDDDDEQPDRPGRKATPRGDAAEDEARRARDAERRRGATPDEGDDDEDDEDDDEDGEDDDDEAREGERGRAKGEDAAAAPAKALSKTERKRALQEERDARVQDRNLKVRDQLLARREQAARRPVALLPGEMVDDALSRGASSVSKWLKRHFGVLQWLLIGGLVAGIAMLVLGSRSEKAAARATGLLAEALAVERAPVVPEGEKPEGAGEQGATPEPEGAAAGVPTFKSHEERAQSALEAYRKAAAETGQPGAATLARLGEAGVQLDRKDYAGAIAAYEAVRGSKLAQADADVRGRALEGIGFAREGLKDHDGALKSFKELEALDGKSFKELAKYHQARIHLAKGERERAKELLLEARKKLEVPSPDDGGSLRFLRGAVDETLRELDPSAVPAAPARLGGLRGASWTKEELEAALRRVREAAEKGGASGAPHPGEPH